MLPSLPNLSAYDVSPTAGFLPDEPPLEFLPHPYYAKWEAIAKHIQPLILSKRLREVIQELPVITTSRLQGPAEWRRAYTVLSYLTHAYIWGGEKPEERVPPPLSIPFKRVCDYFELPHVATYCGLVLWNWKPIFEFEPIDSLSNLSTLLTFTGATDESWFYLISVAIEARGGPLIPLMLRAIAAARNNDTETVIDCLVLFSERLLELGEILGQMYDQCDPHIFYHRIRPFFSGSKNMADAGLPNGVIFDTGSGQDEYVQLCGASNAESSLIQFFDIVLGVEHRPTGTKANSEPSTTKKNNFLHEMRSYMPGAHRRFLSHLSSVANIRQYVETNSPSDPGLTNAYDSCIAALRSLRDRHMQMVSRYIIVKSHEARSHRSHDSVTTSSGASPARDSKKGGSVLSATLAKSIHGPGKGTGTGGTSLIPFLKQARDETAEVAITDWVRSMGSRVLSRASSYAGSYATSAPASSTLSVKSATASIPTPVVQPPTPPATPPTEKQGAGRGSAWEGTDEDWNRVGGVQVVGLSGVWRMDDCEGGICHW